MQKNVMLIIVCLGAVLAACSGAPGSSQIDRVTPLPTREEAPASPTQAPTETDEPASSPTATLDRLAATATQVAVITATNADNRSVGSNNFALMTPTPSENRYEPGEARAIALATDTEYDPEITEPMSFDSFPVALTFEDFYSGFSVRTGLQLSDTLKSLDGEQVVMEGYVAPPLKPRLDFFVLTKIQLAFCPFCSTDVEWPNDIALIYLPEQQVLSSEFPVRVTGQLEIGSSVDAETGMVSLVRIYAEELEVLN